MDLVLFVPLAGGVVSAATQVAKSTGLPDRFAPLFEVVLGVLLTVPGVATGAISVPNALAAAAVYWAAFYGVVVGLIAGGFYTYAKAAREAVTGGGSGG